MTVIRTLPQAENEIKKINNRLNRTLDELRLLRERLNSFTGPTSGIIVAGTGGGVTIHGQLLGLTGDDHPQYALTTHSFLTVVSEARLPNARTPQAGQGILLNDGGAGSSLTVEVVLDSPSGLGFSNDALIISDTIAGAGLTISSKVLNVGAGTLITVGADTVSVSNGIAQYQVPVTGATPFSPSWTNLSALAGTNLTFTAGQFHSAGGTFPTPDTITVTTTNTSNGTHVHAIDHSSNPGAAQKILSSTSAGYLQLVRLGLGVAPLYPLHIRSTTEQARFEYDANNRASITVASDGDITLATATNAAGGDIILDPVSNTVRTTSNYDVELGLAYTRWKQVHGGELHIQNLVPVDDGATFGGRMIIAMNTFLIANVSA